MHRIERESRRKSRAGTVISLFGAHAPMPVVEGKGGGR